MMKQVAFIFCLMFLFSGCSSKKQTTDKKVVVFCAASLTDVITEIVHEFEKGNDNIVKLNIASSGTLARQIEHGAEPAIFISANKKWIDYLNKLNLASSGYEKRVAGNSMVLIAPVGSSLKQVRFSSKLNLPEMFEGRLSIGDPRHVPAGMYAVQTLQSLQFKDALEPRFLTAKDVRSALMVVELGEAEAGIVYKTDAMKSDKVKIITEFPDSLHNSVNYYMTMIKDQKNRVSLELYNYIASKKTIPIWRKYGFKI